MDHFSVRKWYTFQLEYTDTDVEETLSDFQRECQRGAKQESAIEQWAKSSGCWIEDVKNSLTHSFGEEIAEGGEAVVFDHGATLIKSIGLDYFILPILALDRITLFAARFE